MEGAEKGKSALGSILSVFNVASFEKYLSNNVLTPKVKI